MSLNKTFPSSIFNTFILVLSSLDISVREKKQRTNSSLMGFDLIPTTHRPGPPSFGLCWTLFAQGARCSSVVRVFAHGAMGRRIDPSWGEPIELFLVAASAPRLV